MLCYNTKIITNDKQFLIDTLCQVKDLYNYISNIMFNTDNWNELSYKDIHHLVYNKARANFPNLPAQIVIRLERNVLANYKSVNSNKHTINKSITCKQPCLQLDKRLYNRFTQTSIDLFSSTKYKLCKATFVLYPKLIELLSKYEACDPALFVRNNELYISIKFNVPSPLTKGSDTVLGVDRGIRRLITTSDGLVIKGTEFQKHKRKINYLKRCLQSKGTKSAKRKLKKLNKKERNFSKNYCHLVVNELLKTDKDIIVLENLKNIKKNTSKHKENNVKRTSHNRMFSQIPLYELERILTYKAQHIGKRVATVSPYMTSQNDCRGLKDGTRSGVRYYTVDGLQLDADINASINIANRYLKHLTVTYPARVVYVSRLLVNKPNETDSLNLVSSFIY